MKLSDILSYKYLGGAILSIISIFIFLFLHSKWNLPQLAKEKLKIYSVKKLFILGLIFHGIVIFLIAALELNTSLSAIFIRSLDSVLKAFIWSLVFRIFMDTEHLT